MLLLGGEPLNEPIVGHGPFVMDTREEIVQATKDFGSGEFGAMAAHSWRRCREPMARPDGPGRADDLRRLYSTGH